MKGFKDKRIGVLMGGPSSEREISLRSGRAVIEGLQERGYRSIPIEADRDLPLRLRRERIDVAFVALHGKYGEDGSVQGLLEWLAIPYTGSGVLASALAMNKGISRQIFQGHGIRVPKATVLSEERVIPSPLPVVVKPIAEGSSVGVSVVRREEEWTGALSKAFQYDSSILVEEYIEGEEIHVGILEDRAIGAIKVLPQQGDFYDYRSKYAEGGSLHQFPAPLEAKLYEEVLEVGLRAHHALGCRGYSRVDCIVDSSGGIFVLEVNTLPGLTSVSLLPEIAQGVGISFQELVEKILLEASLDHSTKGANGFTIEKETERIL